MQRYIKLIKLDNFFMIFNGNRLIKDQTAPIFLTDRGFRLNGQRVFSYWTALI